MVFHRPRNGGTGAPHSVNIGILVLKFKNRRCVEDELIALKNVAIRCLQRFFNVCPNFPSRPGIFDADNKGWCWCLIRWRHGANVCASLAASIT